MARLRATSSGAGLRGCGAYNARCLGSRLQKVVSKVGAAKGQRIREPLSKLRAQQQCYTFYTPDGCWSAHL
eukprot:CAMPEP_0116961794 /NCGR_PEP_ID=MMETSP0467-20121206/46811_1 /TAXON_ID=283647 /ORGANISM="Mesodinium pulex, Strain SPMC105" /LENGTH=70 /DNA_ID=CAMNT_0004649867 /DNA_START=64 /DNA_END=273 /DNA_ORIENTATION=-